MTYLGYTIIVRTFTDNSGKNVFSYGAELYRNGRRINVTNHGWNLIRAATKEQCINDAKKYISALIDRVTGTRFGA